MGETLTTLPEQDKLTGAVNFVTWKWHIQSILEGDDLWDLTQTIDSPDDAKDEKLKKRKQCVLSIIKRSVQREIIHYLLEVKTPNECRKVLTTLFEVKNSATRLTAFNEFCSLKMESGASVTEFMYKVKRVVSQMRTYGDKLSNEMVVERILTALPSSFDSIRSVIGAGEKLPSIEQLTGRLQLEESRDRNRDETGDIEVLVTQFRNKLTKQGQPYRPPHTRTDDNQGQSSRDSTPRQCTRCGLKGHLADFCRMSYTRIKKNEDGTITVLPKITPTQPTRKASPDDVDPAVKVFLTSTDCGLKTTSNPGEPVHSALSVETNRWYVDSGASCHVTANNGTAERKNRTTLERTISMMANTGLPKNLWAEAVQMATYLINRSPTEANQGTTPFEFFFKEKPDLSNLHPFGCTVYVHVPKEERRKLDSHTIKCKFVGYDTYSKGFRCYDSTRQRILLSRDVKFAEESTDTPEAATEHPSSTLLPLRSTTPEDLATDDFIHEPPLVDDLLPTIQELLPPAAPEETAAPPQRVGRTDLADDLPRSPDPTGPRDTTVTHGSNDSDGEPPGDNGIITYQRRTVPTEMLEAAAQPHWSSAIAKEVDSILKNKTWEVVQLAEGRKPVMARWIFKLKTSPDNSTAPVHKARLVARGFEQRMGIDFTDTYSPVIKWTTLRLVIVFATQSSWKLTHIDIKTAFLYGDLEEEVYLVPPPGFDIPSNSGLACRLKKSLYGLKQAPRACTYIDWLLTQLQHNFDLSNLGDMQHYLRLEFIRGEKGVLMTQQSYALSILEDMDLVDCNPAATPMEPGLQLAAEMEAPLANQKVYRAIVGKLLYLNNSRPDLCFAVGVVSRFVNKPYLPHMEAVKRICRYLKGTYHLGVLFPFQPGAHLIGYTSNTFKYEDDEFLQGFTDADWTGDRDTRRSTGGYLFKFGDSLISWSSHRQPTVALSSAESEYRSLAEGTKEACWLQGILHELGLTNTQPTPMWCDNQASIKISKNPILHARTKHIQNPLSLYS
ncbi:hypothetical protein R1sor_017413 [Riccia sorocarpa]|uniref:Integrase catalytic domain-containing protein n=1 Tax=Riccia sorocarpa TaxID=122646 RepID=A0ABD3I7W3_9MARC